MFTLDGTFSRCRNNQTLCDTQSTLKHADTETTVDFGVASVVSKLGCPDFCLVVRTFNANPLVGLPQIHGNLTRIMNADTCFDFPSSNPGLSSIYVGSDHPNLLGDQQWIQKLHETFASLFLHPSLRSEYLFCVACTG
jgi:hypothetical protein